jgi:hypothetical protein
MSDPTRLSEEERARAALQEQADEINRLERAISQQYGGAALPVAQTDDAPVAKERLFSRRTLFGWAFATLFVVFMIRMVLPLVFETVKESVVDSMKRSTGVTTVSSPAVPPVGPAPAAPATPATPPGDVAPVVAPGKDAATAVAPSAKPGATVVKIHKVEVKKLPR